MTPIKFKEQNVTFAESQPEYMPLPAFKNDSPLTPSNFTTKKSEVLQ